LSRLNRLPVIRSTDHHAGGFGFHAISMMP
jgi:hypothetical protein